MSAMLNHALAASAAAFVLCSSAAARADDDVYGQELRRRPPTRVIVGPPVRETITYEETSPNGALIGSGAIMLGLGYGTSLMVAATSDRPGDEHLFIPVVGPWMDLTNRAPGGGVNETANKVLLVTDGVIQGVGALQILAGLMFPETRTVTRAAKPGVHFAPTGGVGSVGIQAYGNF